MTTTSQSITDIYQTAKEALMAYGATQSVAHHVADATARSESLGNVICGLAYLESYCIQLESGRVNGSVKPRVERQKPSAIYVDGGFGFAQPAFAAGLPTAVTAAKENGVASLAVGHTHTCTSLGYFTEQAAAKGVICIGMTNASPVVAAPGGKTPVIGTNPIALSVPDSAGGMAMHFDFSTSAVALGKIAMAKAAGQPIPLGWAVDAQGNPTTNPEAALAGSLVSAGGYKGWGLGLMVEILAAGMTGSVNSLDVGGLKKAEGSPHDLGQYYLMIDPSGAPEFAARIARVSDAIAADEGARVPGKKRNVMSRVEVPAALWTRVQELAKGA